MRKAGISIGVVAALTAAIFAAHGCKPAESKGSGPPTATSGGAGNKIAVPGGEAAGTPANGGAPASDKNDSSFNLQVSQPAATKAGTECVAHVVVTPGSGYHVNQDFPTKLVVTPPTGVAIAKAEQHKEDAASFSADKLQFDVKLTPAAAGTYKIAGTLKFAVCTESSCDPKKREIAFDVAAQ